MEHKLRIKNKLSFNIKKCLVLSMILVIFIIISFILSKIGDILDKSTLINILIKYKEKSMLIYFLVCFLQPIILPLPEPVTIMVGSLILGETKGAVIGFLGTILGIISMFLFSRYASQKLIKKMVNSKKIEKFNEYIKKNETLIILLLFILPILPDEVICIGAGIGKFNGYKFITIAIISKLITAFTLSYSIELFSFNPLSILIIVAIIILTIIITKLINRVISI
ncbi:VTT domain-containing protein [Clostridium sp. D46t1_190503_E9]|uniref:VTT domain-containing protein n=1 Tax=Clostridium sp. D46t1_190503_E9 TaxID=2787137 RepID=UPI00189C407F|nr:VTT domain-containing protein [Clostridium sp. D46t1_190503_E9]